MTEFIEKLKNENKNSTETPQEQKIDEFKKKLRIGTESGHTQFKDMRDSKQFDKFVNRCKELFSGKLRTNTSRKIESNNEIPVNVKDSRDRKKSILWKTINPILSSPLRLAKSQFLGFINGKTIPFVGKIHVLEVSREIEEKTSHYKKNILLKYFDKIGKAFSDIKKSFRMEATILSYALGLVFSPIGKFLKTIWNGIMHPIDTLGKAVNNRFVKGIFKFGLSSPGGAFMLGAMCGLIYKFFKRFIFPLVDKYITVPFLGLVDSVMDWLDPDHPGTVANIIM